jgi:hypothetical protein
MGCGDARTLPINHARTVCLHRFMKRIVLYERGSVYSIPFCLKIKEYGSLKIKDPA